MVNISPVTSPTLRFSGDSPGQMSADLMQQKLEYHNRLSRERLEENPHQTSYRLEKVY